MIFRRKYKQGDLVVRVSSFVMIQLTCRGYFNGKKAKSAYSYKPVIKLEALRSELVKTLCEEKQ